jgi:predicted DNA-binding transcriptional regulator AlpA
LYAYPPRGLHREDAARYVGVGPRKFDELVEDGRMPRPVRIDGRNVWDVRALDRAFDCLSEKPDSARDPGLDRWLKK